MYRHNFISDVDNNVNVNVNVNVEMWQNAGGNDRGAFTRHIL